VPFIFVKQFSHCGLCYQNNSSNGRSSLMQTIYVNLYFACAVRGDNSLPNEILLMARCCQKRLFCWLVTFKALQLEAERMTFCFIQMDGIGIRPDR
jgi:hypothetical protein